MILLTYGIWWLGILQAADVLTWLLKKAVKKIKKEKIKEITLKDEKAEEEKTKEDDTVWKITRWGIVAAITMLVLVLKDNMEFCRWLYDSGEGISNYDKLDIVVVFLANIKFWRLFNSGYASLRHKAGKDMTEDEKIEFIAYSVFGIVIVMAIYILIKIGFLVLLALASLFIIIVCGGMALVKML